MLTGSITFLEMPGACGLRPTARTHLKKGWWDGGQIRGIFGNSGRVWPPALRLKKDLCHTRRVGGTTDKYQLEPHLWICHGDTSGLMGQSLQALTLFGRVGFIARRLPQPF